jgi:RNA polymerase sigma factor (sigma-70 family)
VALRPTLTAQYRLMAKSRDEETSDEALLVRARRDPQAFEQFYRRHFDAVARFAARRSCDPQGVADLVAAVWLEVLASVGGFEPHRGPALPWVLGIAANLCASARRRQARELEALRRLAGRRALDEDDFARLEGAIDAAGSVALIRPVLEDLPPAERVAAEMVLIDGLTPAEAAQALALPAATVRMRLARARRRLRAAVEADRRVSASANEEASS